jgi:hypothetical protein
MTTSVHRQGLSLVSVLFVSTLFASVGLASMLLAPGAIAQPHGGSAYCAADGPESVLQCLAEAYADRDVDALRALLADDFVLVLGEESNSWGVDTEMAMHQKMFDSPIVQALRLTFADGYRVAPGDEPQTWVISGITMMFALDGTVNGEPKHYEVTESNAEFRVRCVPEPAAHCVIYRWWQEAP